MASEYIFTMHKCSRFYPPDRDVLKDISLSFFPGAKIGVLGANGAGKSSLLKIMAGIDDGFSGEARLTPPYTVGFLPQEPELNPEKTVYENVMDGVGEVADLLTRYDAVLSQWSDPDADFEKRFSFYYDYPASVQLIGSQKDTAMEEIFERITQDVFNASLAKW